MGNNMLITREAYEKTGGYESIKFSITEDLALYQKVRELSGKTIQGFNKNIVIFIPHQLFSSSGGSS